MKKVLLLIVVTASLVLFACSKDPFVAEQNTTNLSKTWFVKNQGSATNYSLFSTRPVTGRTFDSLDRVTSYYQMKDTLQADDHNQLNPTFRANFRIDLTTLNFGAGQYKNWNAADSVILKEGKIVIGGGRSKSGNTVDSIYFRLALKSAPNTDYIFSGHSRTGLLADEY